ncbi:MAG TPA: iron-sulfur cluster assembly scaffold protein [Paenalcaligenes sp.]|nr:iron-sulfur cluster assembly scaffold protein [Paenalcaligenes sp.]
MLSRAIRQRFFDPQWVATHTRLQELRNRNPENLFHARVGGVQQGAVVELVLSHDQHKVGQAYFLAYGSPGLIAFADAFCEQLTQCALAEVPAVQLQTIQATLGLPNTEFHVVLLFNEILEKIKEYFAQLDADGVAPRLATK